MIKEDNTQVSFPTLLVGRSRDRFPVVSLGIFSVVPPTEPCALRSTQPQKMSTRDFSWGKGGRCVWLTTYHPCSAETSRKSGALTYPEPLGPPRPVAGHLYLYLPPVDKCCLDELSKSVQNLFYNAYSRFYSVNLVR